MKSLFGGGGNRGRGVSKQLGVNVAVIVKNLMKEQNAGFVDKTEFNYFWSAMQDEIENCNTFLHLLISHLLDYLAKNRKIPFSPQVLLNTINFLTLRHELPHNKQVVEILKKWKKKQTSYDDPTLPTCKDVLNILHKRYVDKEEAVDKLVIQCYQFYSHEELERIADYYDHPTIVDIICKGQVGGRRHMGETTGGEVCVWSYLKQLALDKEQFTGIISKTLNKFMGIKGQILLLPKLAEISLLALIFMLRQLISYNRVPDEQFLERAINQLKQFYLWPIPYGSQARDLLLLLKKERVAPGFGLISKVWRECHLPEIVLPSTEDVFRPLYYLFDINDRQSILVSNVMRIDTQTQWGDQYEVHNGVSPRTCALLMLNIICNDCGFPKDDNDRKLENALKSLNEHEVILFYKQVIDIFSKCAESNDVNVAKESRKQGLSDISSNIIRHSREKKDDSIDNEDDLVDLSDIPSDYSISLPDMHHIGIACDLTKEEFPSQGQLASAEVTYPVNNVLEKMRNILTQLSKIASEQDPILLRFVIAGGNPILNATITAYASLCRHGSSLLSKFNLEFLMIPYSLNHFSEWLARQDPWYFRHIYLPLQSRLYITPSLNPDTKAKLVTNGKLHTVGQFYREMAESYAREADEVIPLMLYECLCWNDKPFTQTPSKLIPFCQRAILGREAEFKGQQIVFSQGDDDASDNELDEQKDDTTDNIASTSGASGGSTGASSGSTDETNENNDETATDTTVVTTSNNTTTDASNASNSSNNDDVSSTNYEMKTNELNDEQPTYDDDGNEINFEAEAFVFQPFALDVEWQSVDMIGKPNNIILQKQQFLNSLTISSCPRYGDQGFPASPCNEGVAQMYADLSDASRKRKFQEYGLFKSEPSQHVKTVTITSSDSDNKFWVMVDDRCYGPFLRIKVQPMVDPMTKKQVAMPIKTFFPIDGDY